MANVTAARMLAPREGRQLGEGRRGSLILLPCSMTSGSDDPASTGDAYLRWRGFEPLPKPPGGAGSRALRPPRHVLAFAMARRCSSS